MMREKTAPKGIVGYVFVAATGRWKRMFHRFSRTRAAYGTGAVSPRVPMLTSLGHRLTSLIALALTTCLVVVIGFNARKHEENILLQNERTVRQITESVIQGVQTIMLAGHADIAEFYVLRLKAIKGVEQFRILRLDGLEAFKDNESIERVNQVRGETVFEPRPESTVIRALDADDPYLRQVIAGQASVRYYGQHNGGATLTYLWPIRSEPGCGACHRDDNSLRGVLQFTTSMMAVEAEVRQVWMQAAATAAVVLIVMILVVSLLLRRWVVAPIENLSQVMQRVAEGDMEGLVPVAGPRELRRTTHGFNAMLREVRTTWQGYTTERDTLQTLIKGTREGIVATDATGAVVLVNSAAEELLGRGAAAITEAGFERLLDDPAGIARCLSLPPGTPLTLAYRGRTLSVMAAKISRADGHFIGMAAHLRDVTEECRMEEELLRLSSTDGLTGLWNRRHLEAALEQEVTRAISLQRSLAVILFDVDHFKRFNDTHGHALGDQALRDIASATRDCLRTVDVACRYGGEEFLFILPETDQAGAGVVAERMREAVAAIRVEGISLSVSIGVAGLVEVGATTPRELTAVADAALYRAKHGGRNCVIAANPGEARA
jgi:diguanylate cyclase (GGDEF)-like protein